MCPKSIAIAIIGIVASTFIAGAVWWGCDRYYHHEVTGGIAAPSSGPSSPNAVSINGQDILAQPGAGIKIDTTETTTETGGTEHREFMSDGRGPALMTNNGDIASHFDSSAPKADVPGASAAGGTTKVEMTAGGKFGPLFWIGLALVGLGGYSLFRIKEDDGQSQAHKSAAINCFFAGGASIAASFVPGWMWVILILGIIAAVALHLFQAHLTGNLVGTIIGDATRFKEAARAMIAGVEDLPTDLRKTVKSKIAAHAETTGKVNDVETIRQLKAEDGLPSERNN